MLYVHCQCYLDMELMTKTLTITIDSNNLRGCFDVIVHIVANAYLTDWTSFSAFIILFKFLQASNHTWIGNVYRSLTLKTDDSLLIIVLQAENLTHSIVFNIHIR